jgi:hypothetical protein
MQESWLDVLRTRTYSSYLSVLAHHHELPQPRVQRAIPNQQKDRQNREVRVRATMIIKDAYVSMRYLTIASTASLLIIVILWIRSYSVADWCDWQPANTQDVSLGSGAGGIQFVKMTLHPGPNVVASFTRGAGFRSVPAGKWGSSVPSLWSLLGFRFLRHLTSNGDLWALTVPDWFLVLIAGILPIVTVVRSLRAPKQTTVDR